MKERNQWRVERPFDDSVVLSIQQEWPFLLDAFESEFANSPNSMNWNRSPWKLKFTCAASHRALQSSYVPSQFLPTPLLSPFISIKFWGGGSWGVPTGPTSIMSFPKFENCSDHMGANIFIHSQHQHKSPYFLFWSKGIFFTFGMQSLYTSRE